MPMSDPGMRDISDLRIQHGCEYRLFLKQKLGAHTDSSAAMGQRLHARVRSTNMVTWDLWWMAPVILFIALVAAALWIIS